MTHNRYIVGIDGGGTKCKAVIAHVGANLNNAESILGVGVSGGANPFHGVELAKAEIVKAVELALDDANLAHVRFDQLYVSAGLAGVNLQGLFEQMSTWSHPFQRFWLNTDLFIACFGAHKGHDGAVIVTGTGSCGYRYHQGKSLMMGGHGFPHGDKGSGAWFGFKAVEQTLLSSDGLAKKSMLVDMLYNALDVQGACALVEFIADKKANFYGQLASLVFRAGEQEDELALMIIDEGVSYLNNMAETLMKGHDLPLAFMGGLSSLVTPRLNLRLSSKLISAAYPPEVGALFHAKLQRDKLNV